MCDETSDREGEVVLWTPTRRALFHEITAFQQLLTSYAEQLGTQVNAESTARDAHRSVPNRPVELQNLRRQLLRRQAIVQPVFERIIGRIVQPAPFNQGPVTNIWDIAFHPTGQWNDAHFVDVISDYLLTLIGKLESEPQLLDPNPRPAKRALDAGKQSQIIHVHGGTVNIAQTAAGDVTQVINREDGIVDATRLLGDLEVAIRELHAPEDDRDSLIAPVEQLKVEIRQPRPLATRLLVAWSAVQTYATMETSWQGWDRVQRIASELAPKLHALLPALTAASDGG